MSINHLNIEQATSSIEVVSSSVIDKLYELALNPSLDSGSNVQGNLQVVHTYEDAVSYLLNKFPNLQINVTGGAYIRFADSNVLSVLLTYLTPNDGVGITTLQAISVSTLGYKFNANTTIISFNELAKFINVKTLSDDEFAKCSKLQTIDLANVTTLGGGAFQRCTALTSVLNLNDAITKFPGYVFNACSNLTSIHIPTSCTVIETAAFYNCAKLVITDSLSNIISIGPDAFHGCLALTTLSFSSSLTTIGDTAFQGCTALTSMGDTSGITTLGLASFERSGIVSINLSSCAIISNYAFNGCSKLESVVLTPLCKTIGSAAFSDCIKLTNIGDISKVTFIGAEAFADTSITNVSLGEGLTTLGSGAFARTKLDSITLPSTFTTMGGYEFSNTNTPRWAKCLATTPPTGCNQSSFSDGGTYPIYVPDDSLATYKAASGWSNFSSRLKALSTWPTDFPNG